MFNNSKLAKSVKLACAFGALTAATFGSANVYAQEAEADDDEKIEKIAITGSRIARTDMEGALPVTVIDREQLQLSGEISVADAIRNTTFNSAGSFRPQSGSSAQGVSQVDMRGLGASRTLVLIDGRRLTPSPSTGSSQDLNSIPMAAVERIEILSDGASAIYGSDAIGGVINVITRKDFNGVEMALGEARVSLPSDGGDRNNGSVVFGSSNDKTSVMAGVSWNKREIIFQRDYPWVSPGSSTYGNNFTTGSTILGIPGGCTDENFIETEIGGNPRCQYNFNATNANEASTSNESIFFRGTHEITDEWELYANGSVAKTHSFGRYAPAPDSNGFYAGLETPADSYNNPTNPDAWFYDAVNNPGAVAFDPDLVGPNTEAYIYHRFAAMGNRDNNVDNEVTDFMVGAIGTYDSFSVEFGWRRARNKTNEIGNGYLAASTAWSNVNNFNPGYCDDGSFDSTNCRFGYDLMYPSQNPADVLAAGVVTTSRIGEFDFNEYLAVASFDLFEMAGGLAGASVGVERREEVYSDAYDSQSEAGLVGGSSGSSAGGDRAVNAAYFEVLLPVLEEVEVTLAGRYDDYSDFGSNFSPKIGVRYQPMDELVLRGSWMQGFRAPTLDILTQLTSFSAESVTDPTTCEILSGDADASCQINAYYIANPDLAAEESTQFSFGLAYEPFEWGSVSIDYFNIEIEDRIRQFTAQTLIDRTQAGDAIPAGLGVTRNADGVITRIDAGYGNEGTRETSGIDVAFMFNFDLDDLGAVNASLNWSRILDDSVDGGRNFIEDFGSPQDRIMGTVTYKIADFDIGYVLNLIGSQYTDTDEAENGGVVRSGHVGTWVTHDLQVGYNFPWGGKVAIGAQNLFEKEPQLIGYDGRDYNMNLYHAYGRITYARYTQTF